MREVQTDWVMPVVGALLLFASLFGVALLVVS